MKFSLKHILFVPFLILISSCSTAPCAYYFGDCIEGVCVQHSLANKCFYINLDEKDYFWFDNLILNGYDYYGYNSKELSFSDSEGEKIIFDEFSYYSFNSIVEERTITISYSDSIYAKISNENVAISIGVNGYLFVN